MSTHHGRDVRTSASHPLEVNWLPASFVAGVGLTFAPGKKGPSQFGFLWDRDLATDLAHLATHHRIDALVCLMETHELAKHGIADLLRAAEQQGIEPVHFPIVDVHAPRDPRDVDRLLDDVEARLARGQRVAIHCLGGIGRTGTIATCLLLRRGLELAQAIEVVQETRCKRFPEGDEQRPFVEKYAAHVAHARRATPVPAAAPAVRPSPAASQRANHLPWTLLDAATTAPGAPGAEGRRSQAEVCQLLADLEHQIAAAPAACFAETTGGGTQLVVGDHRYDAGQFETPSLATLKQRVGALAGAARGRIRLTIMRGAGAATDIGALQATAPAGTLFQVASQFNCLEAPGAHVVPVRDYPHDSTQGPRASVSAFPGTFLRHYFAPSDDGARFVQTDRRCINLLADALAPERATVQSGYLTADQLRKPADAAAALEAHFDQIRIGLHDGVEVVLGHDWGGPVPSTPRPRIAQVFTSTIALGGYSRAGSSTHVATLCRQLLRAAYLGTLLGALALGKQTVVLTLIGGGAFGNPRRAIWDAIHWALAEAESHAHGELHVIVNARADGDEQHDLEAARARGGAVLDIADDDIRVRY